MMTNLINKCYACGNDTGRKNLKFCSKKCQALFETITITERFRDRIKGWKDARDSSLMDFSFATGISLGTLKPLLYSNRKNFSVYTLDKLCIFFGEFFWKYTFDGEIEDHYLNYLLRADG